MSVDKSDIGVNDLLNQIFKPDLTLRELFKERIDELGVSATRAAEDIIEIQYRTLYGILDGTQKTVDFTNFIRLADFLQISKEHLFNLYTDQLKNNFDLTTKASPEKIKFIKENFDLASLKKAGFIKDISDFEEIESRINLLFGFSSIFEYQPPKGAGLLHSKIV